MQFPALVFCLEKEFQKEWVICIILEIVVLFFLFSPNLVSSLDHGNSTLFFSVGKFGLQQHLNFPTFINRTIKTLTTKMLTTKMFFGCHNKTRQTKFRNKKALLKVLNSNKSKHMDIILKKKRESVALFGFTKNTGLSYQSF